MLSVPCEEGTLLYHTLTGLLLLSETGEEPESARAALIRDWFLVPTDFDENRHADELRRVAGLLTPKTGKKTGFTILTTTDCNARCYYCYEKGIPRFSMSEETAARVGDYIADACGGDRVKLHWFGGEPLANARAIDVICERLRSRNTPYHANMTSNGYYLEPDVIGRAAREWNLEEIQITLDGTGEVYKRTKAYVDAVEDPLSRVLGHIDSALDAGIHVTIRLNVDAGNAEDLLRLCDQLGERYAGRDGVCVVVVLIRAFTGKIRAFATEEQAAESFFRLCDRLEALGLLQVSSLEYKLVGNRCMADNDACEVILPDGRVAKCEHYDEREVVGTIDSPERDEALLRSWKETHAYEECKSCASYPRCGRLAKCAWHRGGCELSKRLVVEERLRRRILKTYREQARRPEA